MRLKLLTTSAPYGRIQDDADVLHMQPTATTSSSSTELLLYLMHRRRTSQAA
jgi:hypothetical protein